MYGLFEEEKEHLMYAAKENDAEWYWDYEEARKAQLLLVQLYEIISDDNTRHIVDKVMEEEFRDTDYN